MDSPKTKTLPANSGKPWTTKDDQALLSLLAASTPIHEIALKFARTSGAIVARQNHIGRQMIMQNGLSVEDAAMHVRRTVQELEQSLSAAVTDKIPPPKPPMKQSNSAEESMLSVMVEIRNLMKQMVANQVKIMNSLGE
jgi:hypothetical protein